MKTRIDMTIHKSGQSLRELVDMIGTANANGGGLTIENVEGWVIACKMGFPCTRGNWRCLRLSDHSVAISEDGGETYVATLFWVELHELQQDVKEGETSSVLSTNQPNDPKTGGDDEQLPFGPIGEPHNKMPEGWDVQ